MNPINVALIATKEEHIAYLAKWFHTTKFVENEIITTSHVISQDKPVPEEKSDLSIVIYNSKKNSSDKKQLRTKNFICIDLADNTLDQAKKEKNIYLRIKKAINDIINERIINEFEEIKVEPKPVNQKKTSFWSNLFKPLEKSESDKKKALFTLSCHF